MQANLQNLEDLNLPTDIAPNFFKPESAKQRVLVNSIKGFGADGKGHVLETKNEAGHVIESKKATLYALVDLLDAETLRTSRWEVLSKPAAVQLNACVKAHAASGARTLEGLMLDIWTTGRGKEKQFHVQRVDEKQLARELDETKQAIAAQSEPDHQVG